MPGFLYVPVLPGGIANDLNNALKGFGPYPFHLFIGQYALRKNLVCPLEISLAAVKVGLYPKQQLVRFPGHDLPANRNRPVAEFLRRIVVPPGNAHFRLQPQELHLGISVLRGEHQFLSTVEEGHPPGNVPCIAAGRRGIGEHQTGFVDVFVLKLHLSRFQKHLESGFRLPVPFQDKHAQIRKAVCISVPVPALFLQLQGFPVALFRLVVKPHLLAQQAHIAEQEGLALGQTQFPVQLQCLPVILPGP